MSFLLNCDPLNRHKAFQLGYLILAGLNAFILIGVAFHSQVWSIKYKGRRLGFRVRWQYVLIICLIVVAISIVLYLAAFKDLQTAFVGLHYFGIVFSGFFIFICLNEIFYLFKIMRISLYSYFRICQALSIFLSLLVVIAAFFVDNWIFDNIMAICICVASIKILQFNSLKETFISKLIVIVVFTSVTAALHYIDP